MAGFCRTAKTDSVKYKVCTRNGVKDINNKYSYSLPENFYGYVIGYESHDKELNQNIMIPYSYDKSIKGQKVVVKALVDYEGVENGNKYLRFDGESDRDFREAVAMGRTNYREFLSTTAKEYGTNAEVLYLDSLPEEKSELESLYNAILKTYDKFKAYLLSPSLIFQTSTVILSEDGFTLNSESIFDYFKGKEGVKEWYRNLNSIKYSHKKYLFSNEFNVNCSFEIYSKFIQIYFSKVNGVIKWKETVENLLKKG